MDVRFQKNGVGDVRSQKKVKRPNKHSGNSGPTPQARGGLWGYSPSAYRAPSVSRFNFGVTLCVCISFDLSCCVSLMILKESRVEIV